MASEFKIESFDDFLSLARRQAEPQQLLFVFTRSESPEDRTSAQAAAVAAGEGGFLAPVAFVDIAPREIPGFDAFLAEADSHVVEWTIVFAAALPGIAARPPTPLAIDQNLERMVESVRGGQVAGYLAFDRLGTPLRLSTAH
ncbi:ribonucleotide reductase subunit alpha [Thiorhodococcus minor]|uniref:Ribonucleotide reductase subunit alpha n=2 Tax=Thiorhodococcus minor TaxID=57489 RepID=A0A6M0K1B7_9GAMM|nr:ribonucleotide reductase subunit alpha [Thiorhodococcus minor]